MAGGHDEGLLIALGGAPKKGAAEGDEPDASSGGDDLEATAAADIIDAVRAKDPGALAGALKTFVSKCMTDYHASDEEEPKEEA